MIEFLCRLFAFAVNEKDDRCVPHPNEKIPTIEQWFQNLRDHEHLQFLVLICLAALIVVIVTGLGAFQLVYVYRLVSNEDIRAQLYKLIFMPPVNTICALMAMLMPLPALILYAVALVYQMFCLYAVVSLMKILNGSRELMCAKLRAKRRRYSLRAPPASFFLFWRRRVPSFKATVRNYCRFEWLVLQAPIVRSIVEILYTAYFVAKGGPKEHNDMIFMSLNIISLISSLIASYGSMIIIPPGAAMLKKYRFMHLFRIIDLSQISWSVKKIVADIMSLFVPPHVHEHVDDQKHTDIPHTGGTTLSPSSEASSSSITHTNLPQSGGTTLSPSSEHLSPGAEFFFYMCCVLCLEMLLASVLSTWWFHPSRCAYFDLYPGNGQVELGISSTQPSETEEEKKDKRKRRKTEKDSKKDKDNEKKKRSTTNKTEASSKSAVTKGSKMKKPTDAKTARDPS